MFDKDSEIEFEKIKSLAKFYDSIPDYGDINHLSENDFNSVLTKLKENSLKLRNKSLSTYSISDVVKNKIYSGKTTTTTTNSNTERPSTTITNYSIFKDLTKSCKKNYASSTNRKKLTIGSKKSKKQLKKSYSMSQLYDDMESLNLKSDGIYFPLDNTKDTRTSFKFVHKKTSSPRVTKPKKKFKNLFANIIPSLVAPSVFAAHKRNEANISENSRNNKTKFGETKKICHITPFLSTEHKKSENKMKVSLSATPSPVYPAARSNLAATLRAQISHKPHLEPCLSPNESKTKSRNRFNWDVKRTPGWKSLIYRETNKEDIMYRLATRKAEQKLQKQEYDMNMELMRQRVKSAPLLLEGMTYWNTRLNNRSYHNCFTTNSSRLSGRRRKNSARKVKPLQQQEQEKSKSLQIQYNINNNNNNSNQFNDNDDLTSEERAYL